MRMLWAINCLLAAGVASGQSGYTEIPLHNFLTPPHGANPNSGLIRDADGNFYGTAYTGGPGGLGTVYKLDPAGHAKVLYGFTGRSDGGSPVAGVMRDAVGNLYGTTLYGGTNGNGVVFKLDPAGHETVLYSFTGQADGGHPYAGVILDPAGNLYGTASSGGTSGNGVVFKLDLGGRETVLHNFTAGTDGAGPWTAVIRDAAGNLYGTTVGGGASNAGTVYRIDAQGHETVLFSSTSGSPGALLLDEAGDIYGTLASLICDKSTLFKIDPTGQETVLSQSPGYSQAPLIRDPSGNFYGTTTCGGGGWGTVFKVDPRGHATVLYSFAGKADGNSPEGGVIRDADGNLYGTTVGGGPYNSGTVFKVDPSGHETVLQSFPQVDGYGPRAGVTADAAGNFYGTTQSGGTANAGTVFRLDTRGNETILYNFSGGLDGSEPLGGVTLDAAGNLYGTTVWGGAFGEGTVFKLDAAGNETVLYSFTGGTAGGLPWAGVIRDTVGNLYGTTQQGGSQLSYGVVFKVDPKGRETVLHSFSGFDGSYPQSGVILDGHGNLYGTASGGGATGDGVIYKVDAAGNETVLHAFNGIDGTAPQSGLIQDANGNLYGTTYGTPYGGRGWGTVFKLDAGGRFTVLHTFAGGTDGANPAAGVVRDAAGNLYGTAFQGGTEDNGIAFKLDPAGVFTVLHSFSGGGDGRYPYGGLLLDPSGNLFGTTWSGGSRFGGLVFALKPQ